jgi:ribosome biogenesis GTPase A
MSDPAQNKIWINRYTTENTHCLLTDCVTGEGLHRMEGAIKEILSDKLRKYEEKGMHGRRVRAMVLGIPNVGKSSLINRLAGGKRAKVEDRPGVTMTKQWVTTDIGLSLLDMPGVLWPKFDDRAVGEKHGITGAIKDQIMDIETLAMAMCERLAATAPELFGARYKLTAEECASLDGYDLFCLIGQRRGFLMSGGLVNERRTAEMLLDEFRGGKIGRISLERPARPKGDGHA